MLPTPDTTVWSRRIRLTPEARRRTAATNASSSKSGSTGSRAMWAISGGSSAPPGETDSPPNIRWSTNRSSPAPCSVNRTRRCRSSGAPTGCTSSCPLIPRWPRTASPLSSGSQRYLPRRRAPRTVRPVVSAAKSAAPARWRRTGRGWSTSTRSMRRPTTCASRPRRTTSTSGSSGTEGSGSAGRDVAVGGGDGDVGRLGGLLLGLLLGPAGAVPVEALADLDLGGEGLLVVGALVRDDVLGDAEGVLGGELLEAGLPVQAGAESGGVLHQRVEEQVHDLAGGLEPAAEVDRADERLDRVGQDRGLVAPAGGLLAPAELDVPAEVDGAGHLGEGAGVHDRGPQLREAALGEVRVGAEQRVGDDHAEHRVAEELQALVGRQAAVLVGERPVGQGAVEQLGVQLGVAEPLTQVVVVLVALLAGHARAVRLRQRTWRRSARAPYWPHCGQARCGRCLLPHAGLAQVTRDGATAFHCERRWRVLLRDIFRFGTATVFSSSIGLGPVLRLVRVGLGQPAQSRPPRVDRLVVTMVGVVRESR